MAKTTKAPVVPPLSPQTLAEMEAGKAAVVIGTELHERRMALEAEEKRLAAEAEAAAAGEGEDGKPPFQTTVTPA